MIFSIKHKDLVATFGTWLTLEQVEVALSNALLHNKNNVLFYDVENSIVTIFDNIIKELEFLKEFNRGYTIKNNDVFVAYELTYSYDYGLMFVGTSNIINYNTCITGEFNAN